MKKFRITKAAVLAAILAGAAVICLSGCSVKMSYNYKNADKYKAGDREITEKIEAVDVDYIAGNVTLTGGKTDKVTIKETSKTNIDDKLKVHTWVDGKTLYVKYCAAAKGMNFKNLKKSLAITVPSDVKLSDVKIDAAAGNVRADCSANRYNLDASAGNITLIQHGKSDMIGIDASAGDVDAEVEAVGKMSADASAGDLKCRFASVPKKTGIDASAGNVEIYLPEKTDLTLKADVSGGEFNSDLPFAKKDDEYIFGNGRNRMDIDASVGDVRIRKNEQKKVEGAV